MGQVEKILIGTILIFGIAFSILRLFEFDWLIALFLLTNGGLIALLTYYLFKVEFSFISIIIITLIIYGIGHIFTLFHLAGDKFMVTIGVIGSGLFAITIIWTKIKDQGQNAGLYYLIGGTLLIQSILYLNLTIDSGRYGELLNYVLVGLIGTIKLKDIEYKYGIDKLLNIYFLYSLTFVIWDTTKFLYYL
jgi:hypothetical protein